MEARSSAGVPAFRPREGYGEAHAEAFASGNALRALRAGWGD
jgi:hypothetical protein